MKKSNSRPAAWLSALVMVAVSAAVAMLRAKRCSHEEPADLCTLDQMLTDALGEEDLACAEYTSDCVKFGYQNPFQEVVENTGAHIVLLKQLCEKYKAPIPDNASQRCAVHCNISEAFKEAVASENAKISMYQVFLAQELPDDVAALFRALKNAAARHLSIFEEASKSNS